MADCIFCKIIKGEIPTEFVYQDEDIVAFRDIKPAAPVHILIIPRKHLPSLNEAAIGEKELLGKALLVAKEIAKKEGIAETGYKIIINCGEQAGQVVFHLHIHLLGGWENKQT
jgi:histidine triad (HIT) family protein